MKDAKDDHGVIREGVKDQVSAHGCDPRSPAEVVARCADAREIAQQLDGMEDPFDHHLGHTPACDVDEMAANIYDVLLGRR